jgi:N6-adenosine-specific RNA methylase IME4
VAFARTLPKGQGPPAAKPKALFEDELRKPVRRAVASIEGNKEVIKEARAEQQQEKRDRREARERALAAKIEALPDKRYGVILADPPWKWQAYSTETGMDRAAENHYPTMDLDAIKALAVPSIAADDCVLWLWATNPMLPQALEVMAAWGFRYVSNYCWGKDKAGTGYWAREKHELLLIGTKGSVPAPAHGDQWESLQIHPREKHSAKPEFFAQIIHGYFPNLPKIELFCRGQPSEGWDGWGPDVDNPEFATAAE